MLKINLNKTIFSYCIIVIYLIYILSINLCDLFTNRLQIHARTIDLSISDAFETISTNDTSVIELITSYNYPAESHEVTTEDGYILNNYRIPKYGKPAILFGHGLIATSSAFLLQGPEKDLAFLLSDEDYDIWLMNVRGSTYSRKHVLLNPDRDQKFWNYSFHEMGYYDLPATIDYILNVTNERSLTFVGHSMGCAVYFVMTTMRPEYNNKIKLMHALSPGVHVLYQPSLFSELILFTWPTLQTVFQEQNIHEILPLKYFTSELGKIFCDKNAPTVPLCFYVLSFIFGKGYPQRNRNIISRILHYLPGGTSINTVQQYVQNMQTGSFRPLNYGKEENKIRYKSEEIFEYDLKKSSAPVILYYGDGDAFISKDHIDELARKLPNVTDIYKIGIFNHIDFLIATDVKSLLYDKVISITNKYRNL